MKSDGKKQGTYWGDRLRTYSMSREERKGEV
jgi:hypothetical protein